MLGVLLGRELFVQSVEPLHSLGGFLQRFLPLVPRERPQRPRDESNFFRLVAQIQSGFVEIHPYFPECLAFFSGSMEGQRLELSELSEVEFIPNVIIAYVSLLQFGDVRTRNGREPGEMCHGRRAWVTGNAEDEVTCHCHEMLRVRWLRICPSPRKSWRIGVLL